MINRYIGSKQKIIGPLLREIGRHAQRGDHVVDIFSGSLAVSLGLKKAGYRVTANDINLFSYVLGTAYLKPTSPPSVELQDLVGDLAEGLRRQGRQRMSQVQGVETLDLLRDNDDADSYWALGALVEYLNHVTPQDLPSVERRTLFFDTYSEAGKKSKFVSSRGSEGRRRFFSAENARRLDLALNQARVWRQRELVSETAHAVILASIMRAAEKVANTQGTFHDFPRDTYDPRALNPIVFLPPPKDLFSGTELPHVVGKERDSLEFITEVEPHAVLYVDPPYNFRQYTAYYFLPNVICRYPDLDDPDEYFENVAYVRGQNPEDDFSSTFCSVKTFLRDLETLIDRAPAEAVVLSYFTGRNHWSDFDSEPDDTGRRLLSELLTGPLFVPDSLRVVEVDRLNYASYGGYKARRVNELILTAEKRRTHVERPGSADERVSTVA